MPAALKTRGTWAWRTQPWPYSTLDSCCHPSWSSSNQAPCSLSRISLGTHWHHLEPLVGKLTIVQRIVPLYTRDLCLRPVLRSRGQRTITVQTGRKWERSLLCGLYRGRQISSCAMPTAKCSICPWYWLSCRPQRVSISLSYSLEHTPAAWRIWDTMQLLGLAIIHQFVLFKLQLWV